MERQGELKSARELYRISAIPSPVGTLQALSGAHVSGMANWRLYLLARKAGDVEGMRQVLEQMLIRRQMPGCACTALAKLYEHQLRDYARALDYARQAGRYPDGEDAQALARRMERLESKIRK